MNIQHIRALKTDIWQQVVSPGLHFVSSNLKTVAPPQQSHLYALSLLVGAVAGTLLHIIRRAVEASHVKVPKPVVCASKPSPFRKIFLPPSSSSSFTHLVSVHLSSKVKEDFLSTVLSIKNPIQMIEKAKGEIEKRVKIGTEQSLEEAHYLLTQVYEDVFRNHSENIEVIKKLAILPQKEDFIENIYLALKIEEADRYTPVEKLWMLSLAPSSALRFMLTFQVLTNKERQLNVNKTLVNEMGFGENIYFIDFVKAIREKRFREGLEPLQKISSDQLVGLYKGIFKEYKEEKLEYGEKFLQRVPCYSFDTLLKCYMKLLRSYLKKGSKEVVDFLLRTPLIYPHLSRYDCEEVYESCKDSDYFLKRLECIPNIAKLHFENQVRKSYEDSDYKQFVGLLEKCPHDFEKIDWFTDYELKGIADQILKEKPLLKRLQASPFYHLLEMPKIIVEIAHDNFSRDESKKSFSDFIERLKELPEGEKVSNDWLVPIPEQSYVEEFLPDLLELSKRFEILKVPTLLLMVQREAALSSDLFEVLESLPENELKGKLQEYLLVQCLQNHVHDQLMTFGEKHPSLCEKYAYNIVHSFKIHNKLSELAAWRAKMPETLALSLVKGEIWQSNSSIEEYKKLTNKNTFDVASLLKNYPKLPPESTESKALEFYNEVVSIGQPFLNHEKEELKQQIKKLLSES